LNGKVESVASMIIYSVLKAQLIHSTWYIDKECRKMLNKKINKHLTINRSVKGFHNSKGKNSF